MLEAYFPDRLLLVSQQHGFSSSPRRTPSSCGNDTLYKQPTSQTSFSELKDDFVYLGIIESDVTNFQGTNDAEDYLVGIPKKTSRQITLLLARKFISMAKTLLLRLGGNTGCMKMIITQTLTETRTDMTHSPIARLLMKRYQNKSPPQIE